MCGLYVWSCFTHIPSPIPKTAPLCVPSTYCLLKMGTRCVDVAVLKLTMCIKLALNS